MKRFFIKFFYIFFCIISISKITYCDDKLESKSFDFINEPIIETSSNNETIPTINAKHAIVLDRLSNNILYGKKENEKCKMASTTKIMTAILVIENCNVNDLVQVSQNAAKIRGSRLGLSENDKISVINLLYGLLLCSGNDAAIALAEHTCRKH